LVEFVEGTQRDFKGDSIETRSMARRTSGEKFGALIREYRKKKGWTQSDLAQTLGYGSPQFISLLERNEAKVPLESLGQMIEALGLPEKEVVESLMSQYREEIQAKMEEGKTRLKSGSPLQESNEDRPTNVAS